MRERIRVSILLVLVTAGFVLGGEVLARVLLWRAEPLRPPSVGFGFSREGYGDLLPGLNSIERVLPDHPYLLRTNSVGLRNEAELNPDPSIFRILAIGDSFVYGYYVDNSETFPARLEETLNQHQQGIRFQVLNAGVPGYTVADQLEYLQEKGLALEPDLVVLGLYTNDVFDYLPEIRQYFARSIVLAQEVEPAPSQTPLASFLGDHSALYNVLMRLRGAYSRRQIADEVNRVTPTIPGLLELYRDMVFLNPGKPEYQLEWDSFDRDFRGLVRLLETHGIPLVIVAFPDLAQVPVEGGLAPVMQRYVDDLAKDTGTLYLDLLPVFRQSGDIPDLYLMRYDPGAHVEPTAPDAAVMIYTGDGHLSPHGHLLAARTLARLLIAEGLVPG